MKNSKVLKLNAIFLCALISILLGFHAASAALAAAGLQGDKEAAAIAVGGVVQIINTGGTGLRVRGPDTCNGAVITTKFDGTRGVVLQGPVSCNIGGTIYTSWKIRWSDGIEGWSAQGDGITSWLTDVYIPPSTKFTNGNYSRASTGGGSLVVRGDPPNLAYQTTVPEGTVGTIIGGPFYGVPQGSSGFYHFWRVNFGTTTGWSAEDYLEYLLPPPSLFAPSNGATGVSQTPTLSWSSVGGASSYRVMVATSPGNLPTDPTATSCGGCVINDIAYTTSYNVPPGVLSQGTTYYWSVHGRSASYYGVWSAKWSFTTQSATPPSAPNNLRILQSGNGFVYIAWDPPSSNGGSPLTYYNIYRGTCSNCETFYTQISSAWTTFNNTNVVNGQTYYYKATALNIVGEGGFSNEVSATPQAPPNPPSHILPADSSNINTLSPTFQWSSDPQATYHGLYIRNTGTNVLVFDSEVNYGPIYGNSFILPMGYLQDGADYRWNMRSWNNVGWGQFTSPWYFSTSLPQPPNAPSTISPGTTSGPPGEIISTLTPPFTWNGVQGADYYGLYIRNLNTDTIIFDSEVNYGPIYGTQFTLPSGYLQNGINYKWDMRAHNSVGWSNYSQDRYFQPGILLPAPDLLTPANGAVNVSLTPLFTWSSVTGATSYRIMVATDPGLLPTDPATGTCPGCIINDVPVSNSYQPTGGVLSYGTIYYWTVHGRSPDYYGAWSAKWSFTTEGQPPVSGKFNIGDGVITTDYLNVRTGAGTGYPEITDPDYPGSAPPGTRGIILNGPANADGYVWWQVDFGPGLYSGWSIEDYLEEYSPPSSDRVFGIDVSHWQGNINWNQVYGAGYRFAFIKATESTNFADDKFISNIINGTNAGILIGAYHFARPDSSQNDAVNEAQHFLSVIGPYLNQSYLRPVLDMEDAGTLNTAQLSQWVHDWMTTIRTQTGVEPLIYTYPYFANNNLNASVNQYDLWIAHWTYNSSMNPNTAFWSDWAFWQFSDNGTVPGIGGPADLDVFNGNLTQLNDFLVSTNQTGNKFAVGDEVLTTDNFNVRTCASTSCQEISNSCYIKQGSVTPYHYAGIITNGPINADGYTWWEIDFGPGVYSGWSVENWLEKADSLSLSVTSAFDDQLLDKIDQYASAYYNPSWTNMNIDQFKAWLLAIASGEGSLGGYGAHSETSPQNADDRFDHISAGSGFFFSTGIGPFQLDNGGLDNWEHWSTLKKLDIDESIKTIFNQHRNSSVFGSNPSLNTFATYSPWYAVKPLGCGNPSGRWAAVTGTNWFDYKDENRALNWNAIKTQLAQNTQNYPSLNFSYEDSVRFLGQKKWDIATTDNVRTDGNDLIVFDGFYDTWIINSKGAGGNSHFKYYYTKNSNVEVWVLDNAGSANEFRYIFTREYTKWKYPEERDVSGNNAGKTLTHAALDLTATQLACGTTITSDTTLYNDLLNCPGDGLIIGTAKSPNSNIILDCNGHTIDGIGNGDGIKINGNSFVTVMNCNVNSFNRGISVSSSSNNSIIDNTIGYNNDNGINLYYSSGNLLSNNVMIYNGFRGINLDHSSYNQISGNTGNNNNGAGIYLMYSTQNEVSGSTLRNNGGAGIVVYADSANNRIFSNDGRGNSAGIELISYSNWNEVHDNTFVDNGYGTRISDSGYNTVWQNSHIGNWIANAQDNSVGKAASTNNWDYNGAGNLWDDFQTNPGYPNSYIIPGTGNAVDNHPREPRCGDLNYDGVLNVLDVVLLINYAFRGGEPPQPLWIGNINGDGVTSDIFDVVTLINHAFRNGPVPAC